MFTKREVLPLDLYEFQVPEKILDKLKLDCDNVDWDGEAVHRDDMPHMGKTLDCTWHLEEKYFYLKKYIEDSLEEVRLDREWNHVRKFDVTSLWPNRSLKGQWHHGHTHGWSFLSGIIYVTGTTGRTWFSRKSEWEKISNFELRSKENYDKENIIQKHKPRPGTMLVFPSNLFHSVDEVLDDEPRVTISFNSFPTGEVGELVSYSGAKISVN